MASPSRPWRASAIGRAAVEQTGDVRVFEVRQHLPLRAEPPLELGRVHASADELDRDTLLETLVRTFGQEHRAHSTDAEYVEKLVGTDSVALGAVARPESSLVVLAFEESTRPFVGSQ